MKSNGKHALLAASCLAALLFPACSRSNAPASAAALGPTPGPSPIAVAGPLPGPAPAPSPAAVPVPVVVPVPSAQASWSDMEGLTFEQRSVFVADLSGLVRTLDGQIGALKAKRATMTTDTADWDIAMMGVTSARDYLAGLASEVAGATPDTWGQEKDRVGAAWQQAQDACGKVRASTAS